MWAKPKNTGGLIIRGQRGNPIVKQAIIKYAKWLRTQMSFPVKLPVYLNAGKNVIAKDGDKCVSIIFLPWKPDVEPYIRLATGDYDDERKKIGRDNAIASALHDLTKNILKYHYWVETGNDNLKNTNLKATRLIDRYSITTKHP